MKVDPRSYERNYMQLGKYMTPSAGIEPGTHWWKASALTTAPTLLPKRQWLHSSVG